MLSRRHEFEADAYACAQADGRALASALLKLHEDNASTLTPDPLYVRFYYSHPPAAERLAALPHPPRPTPPLAVPLKLPVRTDEPTRLKTSAAAPLEGQPPMSRRDRGASGRRRRLGAGGRRDREALRLRRLPPHDGLRERAGLGGARRGPPPRPAVSYNRCTVRFNTHSVGGISSTTSSAPPRSTRCCLERARLSASAPALDLGLVVAAHGRHVVVETPEGRRVLCHPRGKKSELVVGDRVRWQPTGDGGVIEHLEPRRNLLFRQDEWRTKSFAANLDQLLVLVAGEPVFSESQLARALIAAQDAGIPR
jgi:hypothetical protein